MKYRVGKKQNRAILDSNGHEVALFNKGQEELAKKTCELLNKEDSSADKYQRIIDEIRQIVEATVSHIDTRDMRLSNYIQRYSMSMDIGAIRTVLTQLKAFKGRFYIEVEYNKLIVRLKTLTGQTKV